jgi:hypothetical protein
MGLDYPHSESTFPQSRQILAEILEGVLNDEQAKPAPDHEPGIAGGNTARVYNFDVKSQPLCELRSRPRAAAASLSPNPPRRLP